jgi:uncharacterized RDD family membrane protein YckC
MPIEFRCTQCGKLLRVGDETAGRQAKCPACAAVVSIPLSSPLPGDLLFSGTGSTRPNPFAKAPAPSSAGSNPFAQQSGGGSPFAPNVQPMPAPSSGTSFNPYQAPTGGYEETVPAYQPFGNAFNNASRWARLGAALLDSLLYFLAMIPGVFLGIAMGLFENKNQNGEVDPTLLVLIYGSLLVMAMVQWVFVSQRGQTLGKMAVGIRIVDFQSGANPGFVRAVILRVWVPAFIGFIPCAGPIFGLVDPLWIFGEESRCLHDFIAQTRVVNAR